MKRIHSFLALTVVWVFVGNSFALQGQGQGSAGAHTTQARPSNVGASNLGVGKARAGNANGGNPVNGPTAATAGTQPSNDRDPHGFKNYGQYVAAQHVAENLNIDLAQLRAKMTGPQAESLGKAIQELAGLPADAANAEAKKAEQAAKRKH